MSEFVARPVGIRRKGAYLPTEDLLATATNGQAVRMPLHGRTVATVKNASFSAASRRGYRSYARSDGTDHIILWWEKR